ncbi:MAG: TonB-dependent receptor [Planctomycetaceae bacterium]|nr:TonB-dependent receptor [Planctomycetaceae bacterium]
MGKGMAGALCLWAALFGVACAGETIAPAATEYGESLEPQRIVVTATRIPTPVEQVAETVTVFRAATADASGTESLRGSALGGVGLMEARQYRDLADVMRSTPGLSVSSYGTAGSLQDVRMRGLDSNHTGFYLDGMPIDDPLGPNRSTNISSYTLDNIGQVEALRGPQSVSYGSNAMGGVINMTSKRGEGPFSGFVSTEGGSHGTVNTRIGAQAGNARGDFSFGGSYLHTDGWSAADKRDGNRERDGYDRGSVNLRLGLNGGDNLRFDLFANGAQFETDLDGYPPPAYVFGDTKQTEKFRRFMVKPQVTLSLLDGRWVQRAAFGYMEQDRRYTDTDDFSMERNRFRGETTKFDYQSIFHTHENNTILAGIDVITESGKYTPTFYGPLKTGDMDIESSTTTAVYLEDQFNWCERLFLNAGVRYEKHDDFGSKVTWKASGMYVFPTNTKIKASAGTGFSTPTVYALHLGSVGWTRPNPNLDPETSVGWDLGFEQEFFAGRLSFGSSFFWNKIKNKIGSVAGVWPNLGRFENLGMYKAWGTESFLRIGLYDSVVLSLQHTWLRTEAEHRGAPFKMAQRPKHEFSADVDWFICDRGVISAGVHYKGVRWSDYPAQEMPSFTVARVAASWKVNDHLEVFARVENALNRKYQEYYGYGTERMSVYGGMTFSF